MERREDLPFTGLFGTLIVDRLIDVCMLGMILVVIILSSTDFFLNYYIAHPELKEGLMQFIHSPWFIVLLIVGFLGIHRLALLLSEESLGSVLHPDRSRNGQHSSYAPAREVPLTYGADLGWLLLLLLFRPLCL